MYNGRICFQLLKGELVQKSSERSLCSKYFPLISLVSKKHLQSSLFTRPHPIDHSVSQSSNAAREAIDCRLPSYKSNPVSCRSISLNETDPRREPLRFPQSPSSNARRQFLQHFAVKCKPKWAKYLPVSGRLFWESRAPRNSCFRIQDASFWLFFFFKQPQPQLYPLLFFFFLIHPRTLPKRVD